MLTLFVKIFKALDAAVDFFARWALVVCIAGMLFFTMATILCRWISVTILWFDPLIKHFVFLSAFLGGVLASGRGQHIGIDLLTKYINSKLVGRLIHAASLFTLCWLMQSSITFVKDSFINEGIVMLGIHRGYLTAIIPFGFFLLAIRSIYGLLDPNAHKISHHNPMELQ